MKKTTKQITAESKAINLMHALQQFDAKTSRVKNPDRKKHLNNISANRSMAVNKLMMFAFKGVDNERYELWKSNYDNTMKYREFKAQGLVD